MEKSRPMERHKVSKVVSQPMAEAGLSEQCSFHCPPGAALRSVPLGLTFLGAKKVMEALGVGVHLGNQRTKDGNPYLISLSGGTVSEELMECAVKP